MMHLGRKLVLAVTVGAFLTAAGCKKKPKVVPPTPPTITLPPAEQEPPPTPPPVLTEPLPKVAQPVPKKPKVKAKKPRKNAPAPAEAEPPAPKTVIDNNAKPADSNVQITVEVPQGAADLRRRQTEDLLQATEANLRRINRSLSDGEQSMQRQVRNFITQSRLAMQDNDIERAYNLATKANLLSQELVK